MTGGFTCAICLSFNSEDRSDYFVSTKGGHVFHYKCIKTVIDNDKLPVCPVCREQISFNTLTRLYGIERNPGRPCDYVFKIIVIGDGGVGKSSILQRFEHDQFSETMTPTIGCHLLVSFVQMGGKTIKLRMWDTAGQENFRAITPSYLRNTDAIFLVYSIDNKPSFDNLEYWLEFVQDYGPKDPVKVLIGNKSDCDNLRMVTTRMGKRWSEREGISFFETSAKTSHNIQAALTTTTAQLIEKSESIRDADHQRSRGRIVLEGSSQNSREPIDSGGCC